jgi:hypothetical protein
VINENLHKKPVALDRMQHRALKLDITARDLSRLATLNAFFVANGEFVEACKDYPVVWVHAGKGDDGKPQVAPIAVFGLLAGQNLCIDAQAWRVRYVPAMLRVYPFAMARTSPTEMVLCIDEDWKGFSNDAGEALFAPDGTPTEFTQNIKGQLEQLELDVDRTRLVGARLMDKGLLREMRFDSTLPDGSKVTLDGFLTIDDEKLAKLSDAEVLDFARNGILGLIHAHQISMSNMGRLAEWHAQRVAATTAA